MAYKRSVPAARAADRRIAGSASSADAQSRRREPESLVRGWRWSCVASRCCAAGRSRAQRRRSRTRSSSTCARASSARRTRRQKDKSKDKKRRRQAEATEPASQRPARSRSHEPAPAARAGTRAGGRTTGSAAPRRPERRRPTPGPTLPVRVLGKDLRLDLTVGRRLPRLGAAAIRRGRRRRRQLLHLEHRREGQALSLPQPAPRLLREQRRRRAAHRRGRGRRARSARSRPRRCGCSACSACRSRKAWEPQVRYETRAFETRAQPPTRTCAWSTATRPRTPNEDCPGRTMGELKIISGFETFVAGVRYDHGKTRLAGGHRRRARSSRRCSSASA